MQEFTLSDLGVFLEWLKDSAAVLESLQKHCVSYLGFGGMCIYTLREKGIRREYCGVRGGKC